MKIDKVFLLVVVGLCLCLFLLVKVLYRYEDVIRHVRDVPYIERSVGIQIDVVRDYLEQRLNKVAQTQDEYQYSTTRYIKRLEKRVEQLESKQ